MRDDFDDAVRSVLLFLPKALAFVAILVVGWLLARAVRKLVDKLLERVGFDRAVERGGIKTALARSRYDASDVVAKLAYFAVLLLTLHLAFGIWGPNPISDLIASVIAWLPRAFVAIVIVVVAAAIARAVKDIIRSALGGLSYGRLLASIASAFILGLGVIAALNQIGIATTVTTPVLVAVLATIAGILIVGVGGGLVRPMQSRWEHWLNRAEEESRTIAAHTRAYQAERQEARQGMTQQVAHPSTPATGTVVGGGDPTVAVPPSPGPDTTSPIPWQRTADAEVTTAFPTRRSVDTDPEATAVIPPRDPEATMVIPPRQPGDGR